MAISRDANRRRKRLRRIKKRKGAFVSESDFHFDGDKPNSVRRLLNRDGMAFVLLRKSSRQDVADPNIFVERFPSKCSALHTQSDSLKHLGRDSGESRKL